MILLRSSILPSIQPLCFFIDFEFLFALARRFCIEDNSTYRRDYLMYPLLDIYYVIKVF